jgi:hypothetical protein
MLAIFFVFLISKKFYSLFDVSYEPIWLENLLEIGKRISSSWKM